VHEKISWFLKALLLISSLTTLSFADGDNNNCFYTTQTFNMQDAMYIEEKIDYQGDIDWFKGNGPSQFTLHGVMVPPNNRDYDIEIYDYCGGPIVRSCTRGTGETENENCVTPTDAIHGDFYVKVYGFGGGYEANAPYYITAGVKATCDLESQPGYPLQNYFYRNQSLDSYGFYYRNPNSFSIGYYVVSNLFRPTGNFIDKAINNQIQLLSSGESTTFFDLFYPPSWNGNLWPEIGNYKHKTFLLAYCGLGYVDATSKNSFSYPLVCKADGEQCSAPGQNTGECCSGYCNTNSFCGQNAPQPNLQVTQIYTFPGNPTGGQPATVYVTTSETQGVNAPRSCTRLKIDGSDAAAFCQSIQAGNSTTGAIQVNLPVETHNITAIADFWGEVSESNEGDNWLSIDKYWKQPLFMNSQVENLRQRYYKNEAVQYDVYLTDQQTSAPLDGAYVTTLNPFTLQPDWQNTSQQGRYWFDWNATETGLKQFTLNSFKYGYYQKNNYAQVVVTPETARLYATVFNSTNKPVWGAKFKIDGEDRGAAGRNGQIVIPSERGDRRVQVSCPNNNACYDQNIYLNGNTERRFTCNCPDSTTNVVLNLTAFSDALPPNDEYISANGLPIANAMISVDDEFDSILNSTDAGGMLAVKNIPYGYHDFHFYYCLEWNNNTNQCKENSVWRSYSRANIQPGTRYINFALNVDAMRPQGGQANFESFTYKDGKWVMTAGKYKGQFGIFALAVLAVAALWLSEDAEKIDQCNALSEFQVRMGEGGVDCTMDYVYAVADVATLPMGGPGGVIAKSSIKAFIMRFAGKEVRLLAPAFVRWVTPGRLALYVQFIQRESLTLFVYAEKIQGRFKAYLALVETGVSIIKNKFRIVTEEIIEQNGKKFFKVGGEIVDKNHPIFQGIDTIPEAKRVYREYLAKRHTQTVENYFFKSGVQKMKVSGERLVTLSDGRKFMVKQDGTLGNVKVFTETGVPVTEFDDVTMFYQEGGLSKGNSLIFVEAEGNIIERSRLDELVYSEKKKNGRLAAEQYFREIGIPISEGNSVIVTSWRKGSIGQLNQGVVKEFENKGIVITERQMIEAEIQNTIDGFYR